MVLSASPRARAMPRVRLYEGNNPRSISHVSASCSNRAKQAGRRRGTCRIATRLFNAARSALPSQQPAFDQKRFRVFRISLEPRQVNP